jgi:hypothetical protein
MDSELPAPSVQETLSLFQGSLLARSDALSRGLPWDLLSICKLYCIKIFERSISQHEAKI